MIEFRLEDLILEVLSNETLTSLPFLKLPHNISTCPKYESDGYSYIMGGIFNVTIAIANASKMNWSFQQNPQRAIASIQR